MAWERRTRVLRNPWTVGMLQRPYDKPRLTKGPSLDTEQPPTKRQGSPCLWPVLDLVLRPMSVQGLPPLKVSKSRPHLVDVGDLGVVEN